MKGNGYGFGNGRLARRTQWPRPGSACDALAVGTYAEIGDVALRFAGDLVVLTPWRPFHDGGRRPCDHRRGVVHTVGRPRATCAALAGRRGRPRVLLERLTSMKRHGFTARGLREAVASHAPELRVEGVSVHLPLDDGAGRTSPRPRR